MNPDKGLFLFMMFASAGFVTEVTGIIFYVNARVNGADITSSFLLTVIGFAFFAFAAVAYKRLHGRVYN